jgi:hypothetical protein
MEGFSWILRVSPRNVDERRIRALSHSAAGPESDVFPNSRECQGRRIRFENRPRLVVPRDSAGRLLPRYRLPSLCGKGGFGPGFPHASLVRTQRVSRSLRAEALALLCGPSAFTHRRIWGCRRIRLPAGAAGAGRCASSSSSPAYITSVSWGSCWSSF